MSSEIRKLAELIEEKLRSRSKTAGLTPFGDGPFESEVVRELEATYPKRLIQAALNEAIRWNLGEVLEHAPREDAYQLLSSCVFAARFADVALDQVPAAEVASILAKQKNSSTASRKVLADLLRTLARTRTTVNVDAFANLADSHDDQLRTAALELLGRRAHKSFVQKFSAFLKTSTSADQLIWALAHDDTAAQAIVASQETDDGRAIISKTCTTLQELDPGGQAIARWRNRLQTARERSLKGWKAIDYKNRTPQTLNTANLGVSEPA